MKIAAKELQLANGEIIPVGMNFFTLKLMTKYPGGLNTLQRKMLSLKTVSPEEDAYGEMLPEAMEAMGYLLHALVRSGGTQCTQEQCEMAIGPDDFTELYSIFEDFTEAAQRMTAGKNLMSRAER
jgi:hypothetical protein